MAALSVRLLRCVIRMEATFDKNVYVPVLGRESRRATSIQQLTVPGIWSWWHPLLSPALNPSSVSKTSMLHTALFL